MGFTASFCQTSVVRVLFLPPSVLHLFVIFAFLIHQMWKHEETAAALIWDGGFWSAFSMCQSLAVASPWAAWNYINASIYGIGVATLFVCQVC